MLLVGNQRGGARDLAQHLMKPENERVELHELRGFISDDLEGAFQESYAISRATRCKQHLYSLSLSPPKEADVSNTMFEEAADRAEKALGLDGQPRAIVIHTKRGDDGELRTHAHAVWSRINVDEMKAVQMSYDRTKLQEVARSLYRDHGWTLPRGFVRHEERNPRNYSLAEWQQAKRAGKDPEKLKAMLQDAWQASDGRAAFASALLEQGYVLARGDRRGAVAVDYKGEAYAISRYCGVKAKQVRDKLGDLDALPSKDDAHATAAKIVTDRLAELKRAEQDKQRRDQNCAASHYAHTKARQEREREHVRAKIKERQTKETSQRNARLRTGLKGLLDRVTGKRKRALEENLREERAARERDRAETLALALKQQEQETGLLSQAAQIKARHDQTIEELNTDIKRLSPERQKAKDAYIKGRKKDFKLQRRPRSRARDGPCVDR